MKSGTVAVIGRANAGKSTLINVLVGEKVSIVSPKPQTTRDRILAVKNGEDYQIVFEDTPGAYKAQNALNGIMQKTLESAARDVDVILFLIDAHSTLKNEDISLAKRFAENNVPFVLCLTKTDIMQEKNIPEAVKTLGEIEGITEIIAVSARTGKNVKKLVDILVNLLPTGEPIFGDDVISDRSEKFMLGEIMREKILLKYDREIPHGVAVIVNEFERRKDGSCYVNLDIVCEKNNHKGIIIGKEGGALKETAAFARSEMEKFLGAKVFLEVFVKVKEDWRDRQSLLKEYGYGDKG